MGEGPSEHLTWGELACHDDASTPYPSQWRETRAVDLGVVFETFRAECGGLPLAVLSGYRTPEHNARTKGSASKSQHCLGTAIDVGMPNHLAVYGEFVAAAFRTLEKHVVILKGIGIYPSRRSIHLDVRKADYLALWAG